jgi:hypothetical protein
MKDYLELAFWVGLVAIFVGALCLIWVTWENSNSKNLVLATATFFAACCFIALQLPFELKGGKVVRNTTAEFTVDREAPLIRQWSYTIDQGSRATSEIGASQFVAQTNPSAFQRDRVKLTSDFAVFSIFSYFAKVAPDWQMQRIEYRGQRCREYQWRSISTDNECTPVTKEKLRDQLLAAKNSFANADVTIYGPRGICFPPNSSLIITGQKISIENPFCLLTFLLTPSGSINFMQPGSQGEASTLKNGEARYETRLVGIQIGVHYSWLRAQSRSMPRYQDWAMQTIDGIGRWFQGEQPERSS